MSLSVCLLFPVRLAEKMPMFKANLGDQYDKLAKHLTTNPRGYQPRNYDLPYFPPEKHQQFLRQIELGGILSDLFGKYAVLDLHRLNNCLKSAKEPSRGLTLVPAFKPFLEWFWQRFPYAKIGFWAYFLARSKKIPPFKYNEIAVNFEFFLHQGVEANKLIFLNLPKILKYGFLEYQRNFQ